MDKYEFNALTTAPARRVCVEDLTDKTPRTLLYGYTSERATWHVYLGEDARIHLLVYQGDVEVSYVDFSADSKASNSLLLPNKRLYPESCDYDFCRVLQSFGEELPFTTYSDGSDERRKQGTTFAGSTREQLTSRAELVSPTTLPEFAGTAPGQFLLSVEQAALELRAFFAPSYGAALVESVKKEEVLKRARAYLDQAKLFNEHWLLDTREASNWLGVALGAYDSIVCDFSARGGHVVVDFVTSEEFTQEGLTARGFTVRPHGSAGFQLESEGPDRPLRVLVPRPGAQIGDSAQNSYLLYEHQFGCKSYFMNSVPQR